MLIAVGALSGGWMALIYLAAFVLFVLAAVAAVPRARPRPFPSWWPTMISSGLALCAFVLFWNAWALTGKGGG